MKAIGIVYRCHAALAGFALLSCVVHGQQPTYTINTVVGGAPQSVQNPRSLAVATPHGIVLDSKRNLYFSDPPHELIYELDTSTGVLSAVVGSGGEGFAGDGGPAPAALLGGPSALFLDSAGNMFICDVASQRIRVVNTAAQPITIAGVAIAPGTIETVAGGNIIVNGNGDGGPATKASLYLPLGVFVDAGEHFFIADAQQNLVRVVNSGTSSFTFAAGTPNAIVVAPGTIETVAGNGQVGFTGDGVAATNTALFNPSAVSEDLNGNLFIADTMNHRIRVINTGTQTINLAGVSIAPGTIQTIAGTGVSGFVGDFGPPTSAELNSPQGVFVDSAEHIFIADTANNRIRLVNGSASGYTVLGGLSGDVVAPNTIETIVGNCFFQVPQCGALGDGSSAVSAALSGPTGVVADPLGNIFIADTSNNRIRMVSAQAGVQSFAGITISQGTIQTLAGSGSSDAFSDGSIATNVALFQFGGVAEDANGNIFTTEGGLRVIKATTPTNSTGPRTIQTIAGNGRSGYSGDGNAALAAQLNLPSGLFVDGAGNIFIADNGNQRIRFVNTGPSSATIDGYPSAIQPGDIQTIVGGGGGCQQETDAEGDGCPASDANLSKTTISGVFVDSLGLLYFTDGGKNVIHNVTNINSILTMNIAMAAQQADSVFEDSHGNVFATGGGFGPVVNVLNTSNQPMTIANVIVAPQATQIIAGGGSGCPQQTDAAGDGCPATDAIFGVGLPGLFVDGNGDIFVADTTNFRIRKIDGASGIIETVAGTGQLGFSGDGGPAIKATLNYPGPLWGDQVGNLLIADGNNGRIREIEGIVPVPNATLSCASGASPASSSACGSDLVLTDGGTTTATVTVTNTGTAPLAIGGIGLTDATHSSPSNTVTNFQITSSNCPQAPQTLSFNSTANTCTITIGLLSIGNVPQPATLVLTHNAGLGSPTTAPAPGHLGQLAEFQQEVALVREFVPPSVSVNPVSLTFVSANAPLDITMSNTGTVGLTVSPITPPPAPFVLGTAAANPCPTPASGFTLSGNQSCELSISFSPTAATAANSGALTITSNAPNSPETLPLVGYALIPAGPTSFAISNSAPSPVTANFTLVGVGTTSFTPVCVVTPAGLDVNCTYSTSSQTLAATAEIPSCVVSGATNNIPSSNVRWTLWMVCALLVAISLLVQLRNWDTSRRTYALLGLATILWCSGLLTSCNNTHNIKSSSCVASVNPGAVFSLNVTATTTSGQVPSLTLTNPDTITVTK